VSRAHHGVALMHCRSADAMSSRCGGKCSRRVFYKYNLPHVIDLSALAKLAELMARVQTATGSSERS
jgi:hypothetical protein